MESTTLAKKECSRRNSRSFGRAPYSSILGRNVMVLSMAFDFELDASGTTNRTFEDE